MRVVSDMNRRSFQLDQRLRLYRAAVQHPLFEVAFAERVYKHHNRDVSDVDTSGGPLLLREDFSGTGTVAAMWVLSHPERQAVAVDRHGPTMKWASRQASQLLSDRANDWHGVTSDVLDFQGPRVDVVISTNFGVLYHHTRDALVRYLKHVRRCLRPGGVMVFDFFGGPGAMRPMVQRREHVTAGDVDDPTLEPFGYEWEQRRYDPATGRIECRIHFEVNHGSRLDDAFVYDWRLWQPQELVEAMTDAGFRDVVLWHDAKGDRKLKVVRQMKPVEDFVAYVSGTRR